MDISPLLIVFGISLAIFAGLLVRARGCEYGTSGTWTKTGIAIAALAAINIAGAIGVGWFVAYMLYYDGVMVFELSICAVLIAILVLATGGGFALRRRGMIKSAIALLAVAAVPTMLVYGGLLYLDSHPIDMR